MLNRDLICRTLDSSVPTLREYGDPFYAMQCEMDRMIERFFGKDLFSGMEKDLTDTFEPRINVKETDKDVVVSAELPGIDGKDVEVLLSGESLVIKGEKKFEKEDEEDGYRRVERRYGSFRREIPLEGEVDADKTEAKFDKGILTVTLLKNGSKSRSKKIQIKT